MTVLQRKFVESRLVLALLLVAVTMLQEDVVWARTAFGLAAIYGFLNWKTLSEIERNGPRLVDVLSANTVAKYWLGGVVAAEASLAYYYLLSGRDLGEHLDGFGTMFLAFIVPLAPALCVHQRAQFVALRHAP